MVLIVLDTQPFRALNILTIKVITVTVALTVVQLIAGQPSFLIIQCRRLIPAPDACAARA